MAAKTGEEDEEAENEDDDEDDLIFSFPLPLFSLIYIDSLALGEVDPPLIPLGLAANRIFNGLGLGLGLQCGRTSHRRSFPTPTPTLIIVSEKQCLSSPLYTAVMLVVLPQELLERMP